MTDTIFALSSGAPPAAVAIIRVSGPAAFDAAARLGGLLPEARRATLRTLRDSEGAPLDGALVLAFPAPRSATGENLVEFHLHGGRAVVRAVEKALSAMPGLRSAIPGEFTRRALTNGRIDLTEAEGLGDLLMAETERQRRAALATAQGAVGRMVETWRDRLLQLAARVEAEIDFSDDEDVPATAIAELSAAAVLLGDNLAAALAVPSVERLRDGLHVVIAGPPNSGKSTLLNVMADREAAIVSPISGTTRDRIEVPVVREGIAYILTDTAGLTEATDDPIERIGIARADEAMRVADVVLWLGDEPPPIEALWVHARADQLSRRVRPPGPVLAIAAARGEGIADLWRKIAMRTSGLLPVPDTVALNRRQRDQVHDARWRLENCAGERDPLLLAENLRLALQAFDQLTGRADVEAMLDTLFSRFCIGK